MQTEKKLLLPITEEVLSILSTVDYSAVPMYPPAAKKAKSTPKMDINFLPGWLSLEISGLGGFLPAALIKMQIGPK